jgi:hypothetical protein
MMQQAQPKGAATRADAATVRSPSRPIRRVGTLLSTSFNRDVPQHVVQKILDHDSPEMTAHYARLSDKTVREHWEKARKVSATGQPVQMPAFICKAINLPDAAPFVHGSSSASMP